MFTVAVLIIALVVISGIQASRGKANPNRSKMGHELNSILSELWNLDHNRCNPGQDYEIALQGNLYGTRTGKDVARKHLFKWLDDDRVFSRPTYKAFRNLLDNYEMEVGTCEVVSSAERKENAEFLHAVMQTEVMQRAHQYLVEKGLSNPDDRQFMKQLDYLWFQLYRRTHGCRDSSGFEHVFVGEVKGDIVMGLHNWIQFYLQEKAGNIDYKGFFKRGTSEELEEQPRLITLQFTWKDKQTKPLGGTLIGGSPELELAVYTVAFLTMHANGEEKVRTAIGPYEVVMHCFTMAGNRIGTAYIQGLE